MYNMAVLTREKGRDIYDLWYLLHKGIIPNTILIQKKLDYYHEKYNPKDIIDKISGWSIHELQDDLRKFLPIKDRGIIEKLKEMLLDELSDYLK